MKNYFFDIILFSYVLKRLNTSKINLFIDIAITKYQGLTTKDVGVHLRIEYFSQGQLYVRN